nr:replication protein A 70 kDa DNA-binding subunit B-like [Ipomoea batatas]
MDINEKELIDVIGMVVEMHSPQEKVIAGKPTRLIDFLLEDTHLKGEQTPMRSIVSMTSMSYGSAFEDLSSGQMNDPKLVTVYCRELLEAPDKDLTSELPKSLERILRMRMLLRVQVYQQIP